MGVYARKKNDRKEECMETIIFDGEDGTELELGILEQTRVNGSVYLLVVDPDDSDDEGAAAYILKEILEDGRRRRLLRVRGRRYGIRCGF